MMEKRREGGREGEEEKEVMGINDYRTNGVSHQYLTNPLPKHKIAMTMC